MITKFLPLDPTLDQIEAAHDKLIEIQKEQNYRAKFLVVFNKPTQIVKGGHYVTVDKMTVNTFKSHGLLCYTFGSHRGWAFNKIGFNNIKSISIPTIEEVVSVSKDRITGNINKALRIIHPNAWDDLKADLKKDPSKYEHYGSFLKIVKPSKFICHKQDGTTYRMNKSVLPEYAQEALQLAFDNKTDFNYNVTSRTCRISVECKLGADGVFRAWYSRTLNDPVKPSKYSSGGRDFAYLLLNPTTAWFVERD